MSSHPPLLDDPERGNTLILSIVLSAVAIALVLTFATITQIHIERKRLLALSDAAALFAASELDEGRYYTDPSPSLPLTDTTVQRATEAYLDRMPAAQAERFHSLAIVSPTGAIAGETAQVTLTAYVRPGYIPWGVVPFDGFYIETTSLARAD